MTYRRVVRDDELTEGAIVEVELDGRRMILCQSAHGLFALDNLCPHNGARLGKGRLVGGSVACPLHGARFALETGVCRTKVLKCPSVVTHGVRARDGWIEIELSDRPTTQPLF